MNFQLPGRDMPPPQFGQPQPQLTPEQLNAVNGNGMMPAQAALQQYGQPNQVPGQPAPTDTYMNHPRTSVNGMNSMAGPDPSKFTGAQGALADAMATNPGAGYLQRGLGGAPAPSSQLQGVAQQVRPPPMLRASPQPNRIAGYPAYRQR